MLLAKVKQVEIPINPDVHLKDSCEKVAWYFLIFFDKYSGL